MKLRAALCIGLVFLVFSASLVKAQTENPPSPEVSEPQPLSSSSVDNSIQYNALYATASSNLWVIDASSGQSLLIGPIGYQGTDIAFYGKELYGVSFSQFYRIDPVTGTGIFVGNIGFSDVNALAFSLDGTAYGLTISGNLIKINPTTGVGTLVGNMGSQYSSSGDLAIDDQGQIFAAVDYNYSWESRLVYINPNNGAATLIGNIGFEDVWGLSFLNGELYGVTLGGDILRVDQKTGYGTWIGESIANFWGLSTSGKALNGSITSPVDHLNSGPASFEIHATAAYPGGNGVKQVEFSVFADGTWRSAGSDISSPYVSFWTTPANLASQQILLRIDVVGNDLQRTEYAGGVRHINIIQSLGDSGIEEYWLPQRAYLSQRALGPNGDIECSVASMAMVLAMEGKVQNNFEAMKNKANTMYPRVLNKDGDATVGLMAVELKRQGTAATYFGPTTNEFGWSLVKDLIDAGHPVIVRTAHGVLTRYGHFVVAVGYQEASGIRKIIAYDPFGQWRGLTCAELGKPNCSANYYLNAKDDPLSHVGQWVYYDFDKIYGDYLIAAAPPASTPSSENSLGLTLDSGILSSPDVTSNEEKIIGTNPGVVYRDPEKIFLPIIRRR